MNSKAEYQQGEVARVVLVRGLAECLVGWLQGGATLELSQGGEPFPWSEIARWLIRLSRKH